MVCANTEVFCLGHCILISWLEIYLTWRAILFYSEWYEIAKNILISFFYLLGGNLLYGVYFILFYSGIAWDPSDLITMLGFHWKGGDFQPAWFVYIFLWIWNSTLSAEALYETPSCCIECAAVLFSLENLIHNVFQPFYLLKVVEGCVVLFIYWMVFI